MRPLRRTTGVDVAIFDNFSGIDGGLHFLARYGHVLFGIAWIGLLYFFNFVQVPAFAEMEAGARSEALRKITFRALWWFRFAALATFLTGGLMYGVGGKNYALDTAKGMSIAWGALLATTMFLNVWGVIWRNQKINIASAEAVANGGQADPAAAGAAKKAARASRANAVFSIPMLFFMVFTSHFSGYYANPSGGKAAAAWILFIVLWAVVEASALGFIGGLDGPINKLLFDDHRKTIVFGVAYWLVLFLIGWEAILGAR
jgi:uncharacterized membrane protein